jgi:hypothetical protein
LPRDQTTHQSDSNAVGNVRANMASSGTRHTTATCNWNVQVVPMSAADALESVDVQAGPHTDSIDPEVVTCDAMSGEALVFQDELALMRTRAAKGSSGGGGHSGNAAVGHRHGDSDNSSATTVDEMFFELANAACVGYR